jgi:hypothetical protein
LSGFNLTDNLDVSDAVPASSQIYPGRSDKNKGEVMSVTVTDKVINPNIHL